MEDAIFYLMAHPYGKDPSLVAWLLWIEQDGQGNRFEKLWAGRVKFQDDPVATTYAVLENALDKLEPGLQGFRDVPLF